MKRTWTIFLLSLLIAVSITLSGCGGGNSSGGTRNTDTGGTTNANMLFVAGSNSVTAYEIGSTGALTQKSTTAGVNDSQVAAVSPDGNTLAITNLNGITVSSFRINKTTGALTAAPGSPFASGAGGGYPRSLTFSPNSGYLYLGRTVYADRLDVYTVNATTSALSLVGAPAAPGYTTTRGTAVHPDGSHVYFYGNGVAVYQNNGGILVPVNGSPFLTSNQFVSMFVHPSGNYLVAAEANFIHVYSLANGVPGAELSGSPVLLNQGSLFSDLIFSADGSRGLAVIINGNAPAQLISVSITVANGAATVTQTGSATTTVTPSSLTVDSTGKFAYVIDTRAGQISGFSIGTNGSLTPIGSPMSSTGIAIAASR